MSSRSTHPWAVGVIEGNLKIALAEIDGLSAGLIYLDWVDAHGWSATRLPAEPNLHSHLPRPPNRPTAGDPATAGGRLGSIAETEDQPMASQWAAIRSLRGETAFHHERFQQLCRDLQDPALSKLLEIYPDAQKIRKRGAQLVKDVLEGCRPRELSLVFAFTSFSYAISQLLYKNGRLKRNKILEDIGAWRSLIDNEMEKQTFDLIAQYLWPEAKDHLECSRVPDLVPTCAAWGADAQLHGRGFSSSPIRFAATPNLPCFQTHGQDVGDPRTPSERCPVGFGDMAFHMSLGDVMSPGHVVGDSTGFLMNMSHGTFRFSDFSVLGDEFPFQEMHPALQESLHAGCIQAECTNSTSHLPGAGAIEVLGVGRGPSQLAIPTPPKEKQTELYETGMFLVVFVFLQDVAQLVNILSGSCLLPKHDKRLYKAEQKAFYQVAQESLFTPLYHCQSLKAPACLALLFVAEKVTKRGLLRNIPEIKHYLTGVALAVLPPGDVFETFLSAVLAGGAVATSPIQPRHTNTQKRKRQASEFPDDDCSSPESTPPPKPKRPRTYKCEYGGCDASYSGCSGLRKHKNKFHGEAAELRCSECDYGHPGRDRVRRHFLTLHPDVELPEWLRETRRGAAQRASSYEAIISR